MNVHVLVGIGVIEPEPGGGKGAILAGNLCGEASAAAWAEEVVETETELIAADRWRAGQDRVAFDGDEMQANGEGGQGFGPADSIRSGGAGDHEAGGRQDALTMRQLDGLVHLDG